MVGQTAPFAKALLELGQENGKEEQYLGQLREMEQACRANEDLKMILMHPSIPSEQKNALLRSLFPDVDQTMKNFLQVLVAHRMSGHLDEIADEYQRLYDESHNIETVQVTSAAPLDQSQQQALCKALEMKLGCRIRMNIDVDPSLIAGMRIVTPHATIDGSYQGRLDAMKEQLRKLNTGDVNEFKSR